MCRTDVCWLCGGRMPYGDPYSHFQQDGPCQDRANETAAAAAEAQEQQGGENG